MLDGQCRHAPKPHATLNDEGGSVRYWLDSAWSFEDIADEWEWLFEDATPAEKLGEMWLKPRWTTDDERKDEDCLYDLFGDGFEQTDTSVYYDQVKPNAAGAYRYWTTEVAPEAIVTLLGTSRDA